ncbi:MAG: glycosyltransferase family 4 protein [Planctomycetota bacterium]|nr:glycosyltransferase family 4 protein [Planctomycetota bacterium]
MQIAYFTAGAAGMYCGSCLHDNALAKALNCLGHDCMLLPTYTPIRTDEKDISSDQLFFGGLNVYLQQMSPLFRWLPKWADSFLSSPRLVNWIASRSMGTTADKLGALTVSMLKGSHGHQAKEVSRLCDWLEKESPDVVVFSNLLIAGCIPEIQRRLGCPSAVILQGDDIFYDGLSEPYREQATTELRRLAKDVDRFVVNSQDYGKRMQEMLGFSDARLAISPLCLDTSDFEKLGERGANEQAPTIGYLARLAPEKGLDILIDAFLELAEQNDQVQLNIAGWLGDQNLDYWSEQQEKLSAAGLSDRYQYFGEVDREGKLEFLRSIDVLSVPTPYLEPKGLFVLEALAAGVPYLQPAHGAFPEIHERLGGGRLFPPESASVLAEGLAEMLADRMALRQLGAAGRTNVLQTASSRQEAERFSQILGELVQP